MSLFTFDGVFSKPYQRWSICKSLVVVVPICALMGGIQASLVVALRIARSTHIEWPVTLMAILSAALLAAGVLCHYWDIYTHRTVRGISFIFVGIDAMGDLTSLISIVFQPKLDILGMVIYGTELVLWLGVFACGGYYNLTPWLRKHLKNRKSLPTHPAHAGLNGTSDPDIAARNVTVQSITMHDLPSSTSVFRTPSREIELVRSRNTTLERQSGGSMEERA